MLDRYILKDPFDRLFNRALSELGISERSKQIDVSILRALMTRLLDELITEKFSYLAKMGERSRAYLAKRQLKARKILFEMLERRLEDLQKLHARAGQE